MPRKVRDERLDSRTARLKLAARREPYWRGIQQGRLIGYRRVAGGKSGHWIAQFYQKDMTPKKQFNSLGTADDLLQADGNITLTFTQAQDKAAEWFGELLRHDGRKAEPLTVRQAMEYYLADYTGRGGKALKEVQTAFDAHILPAFADTLVTKLTTPMITKWLRAVAAAPARLRVSKKPGAKPRKPAPAATSPDAMRARRASANRVLTNLKAALNLAYHEQRVPSDDEWRRVKPFKNVDAPRIRHLSDDEAVRLINASPDDFRALVKAALMTGCRYGELAVAKVNDLDLGANRLRVPVAKGAKARAVILTDDAIELFGQLSAGKKGAALLFTREDGSAWGKSYQQRPITEACKNAEIAPAVNFYALRHTHESRLAMAGTPMYVIAAQLGNSEAICSKHYAHLSPSYVSDTIRANFKPFAVPAAPEGTAAVELASGAAG